MTFKLKGTWLCLAVFLIQSCGGQLSDEQRKRLKEGMKKNEIRRISEATIMDKCFSQGRKIVADLGNPNTIDALKKDSLGRVWLVKIVVMHPKDKSLSGVDRQIMDAYQEGAGQEMADNVQRLGTDSLLYTRPVTRALPDGSQQFVQAIGVRISRKQLVLSIRD